MKASVCRFSILALAIHSTLALADPAATSAYHTDTQNSHVEDATSKGVGQVNFITCLMAAMRPEALVNQGNYVALVDESKCDSEAQSGSNTGASYMTAIVNATRTSNSDPMISRIWIDEESEGGSATIFVRVSATAAPTTTNPYGFFRLDFCGTAEGLSGCMMNGYLEGSETGMRYFEDENQGGGGGPSTKAVQLNAVGTTSGSGRMSSDSDEGSSTFDFAYNATLFRRSADGSDDQCFSRNASDPDTGMSVWRYGLYDVSSGERITRNSGFPIEYTNGGTTYRGYLGYYGLSLPPDALSSLTSGSTVQKVDYTSGNEPTKTDYSVVKADGKLTKYTRQATTLHQIDKVKFNTFVGNEAASFFNGAAANTNYELYWDDSAGNFKVTGQMNCSNNGCSLATLPDEQTVTVDFWQMRGGVQGWSNSLGGEVFIQLDGATGSVNSDAVDVIYRVQDLVYPSQLPTALYCLRDCPTSASMASYFAPNAQTQSPFAASSFNNFQPVAANDVITYHTDIPTAMLKDAADQAVAFTDREALQQQPQYQHGIRSGRLFTNLAAAQCDGAPGTYCDWKVNDEDVYYQWETGANSHNQFAAVKDSSNEFVAFDAPLQVNYSVPNDADKYREYAGQNIVLQYGGFGELWGIPGHCVSRATNEVVSCDGGESRYVAAFTIPMDATVGRVTEGTNTYLVKWLDREIRFARKDPSVCVAAGLELPTGITLPTAADLKDPSNPSSDIYIGAKPVVDTAPRVIHGDVKY